MESPLPRSQHAAITADKNLGLIFGGFCASKNLLLNDLWTFEYSAVPFATSKSHELAGGVWSKLAQSGSLPAPRRGHTLTKLPG